MRKNFIFKAYKKMGCLKLSYYEKKEKSSLRVAHSSLWESSEKRSKYYPFGLTMAGISSKASMFGEPENKYKYNGIEKENDLGLEIYDAQLRELDGQIGRWWEIDPETENMEMWSPYASNYDNPITYMDPLGNEPECCKGLLNAVGDFLSDYYHEGVLPGLHWINKNVNPLYGAVNGAQSIFTGKSLYGEPMSKGQGVTETLLSVIPGGKIEGAALKVTEKVIATDAVKAIDKTALKRGVQNEEKVLAEEGLKKNTKVSTVVDSKTGKNVSTIPDAMKSGGTVEVKDVKKLTDSKQLRAQTTISAESGMKATVITGTKTRVSSTVRERMNVQTKHYLGPQ
jgi:RHS repeat-associated protein